MKKLLFIAGLVSLFGFSVLCPAYTQDQDLNVLFEELRNELLNSKVPIGDINAITQVSKSLLNQGATKGDLMNMVLSITKKGIASRDLNTFLGSVNTLVESGVKVSEAGNVVLQAIDQGMAYGFKDGDLGLIARVQEAVKQKQAQLLEEIKQKDKEKNEDQENKDLGSLTSAMSQ